MNILNGFVALPVHKVAGLAAAFFRAGYIESWGRGIDKIKNECKSAGVPLNQTFATILEAGTCETEIVLCLRKDSNDKM